MIDKKIGFIGAGNMAKAIINGLISNNVVNKDDIKIIINLKTKTNLVRNINRKFQKYALFPFMNHGAFHFHNESHKSYRYPRNNIRISFYSISLN